MKTPNLKGVIDKVIKAAHKHGPEILIGVGIVGMASGAVTGIAVTPKALKAIEHEKDLIENETGERPDKLPFKRLVKSTWKYYLPVVGMEVLSGACIIGASSIHLKRNAALMTAYTLSETARKEYADKVIETVGEKKEKEIRDKVAEDQLSKHPIDVNNVIETGNGRTLCFDPLTARYFKSDIESIRQAVNVANETLLTNQCLPLNDFYYEIGLPEAKVGDILGWNIEDGLIKAKYSSQLSTDGTPCLVVSFTTAPFAGYDYP